MLVLLEERGGEVASPTPPLLAVAATHSSPWSKSRSRSLHEQKLIEARRPRPVGYLGRRSACRCSMQEKELVVARVPAGELGPGAARRGLCLVAEHRVDLVKEIGR